MVKNMFFTKFNNRFEIYTKSYLNTQIFKKIGQEFTKLGSIAGSTLEEAEYFESRKQSSDIIG
jgi:hypothetical protein